MGNISTKRYSWLQSVLESAELNANAKMVASAMVVKYADKKTGQFYTKTKTIAESLKVSLATAKRAISDLVKAGWLHRTEGRGFGNKTVYNLFKPSDQDQGQTSKSDRESDVSKGSNLSPISKSKGSNMSQDGVKFEPSYNKAEHCLEHCTKPTTLFENVEFVGNAHKGLRLLRKENNDLALMNWGRWVIDQGFPPLHRFPLKAHFKGQEYWRLPWTNPPTTPEAIEQARSFFIELSENEGARYAAQ